MGLKDFRFKVGKKNDASNNEKNATTVPAQRNSLSIDPIPTPSADSSGAFRFTLPPKPRYEYKTYRLRGEYEQPWAGDVRMKRTKYSNWIVYGLIVVGFLICGYLVYDGMKASHSSADYCLVMEDNFDKNGVDDAHWTHEVQMSGFGTGSFDWTTNDPKNTFTDGEGLHIVPTLTTESTDITEEQLFNGYTVNITKSGGDGSCTSDNYKDCSIKSNNTLGTVIPPVRSARLSTKGKKFIKYGRVEVVAKMPQGDWLWPAIWMMPEESKYGPWPASGEIDIAELRGNDWQYPLGRDGVTSTLHWGPASKLDAYWRTYGTKFLRRTDFSKGYHTFGMQWSKDYLYTYLDSRLKQVFYMKFDPKKTMWEQGGFAGAAANNSLVENPWDKTGNTNTPFDENFFLILNVAVGASNGWFYEGKGNKPWVDDSPSAQADFIKAKDQWLPTWGAGNDRGMTVKSVKMWQEGGC